MKIHSLKLTLQDAETQDRYKIAVVYGSVTIDNDVYQQDSNGDMLDEEGKKIPLYETVNFTAELDSLVNFKEQGIDSFRSFAQNIITQALSMQDSKIVGGYEFIKNLPKEMFAKIMKMPKGRFKKNDSELLQAFKKPPKAILEGGNVSEEVK